MWSALRDRRLIRFWNHDVLANTSAVTETIMRALEGG
jgi:very-short-patch-repair endonuclease